MTGQRGEPQSPVSALWRGPSVSDSGAVALSDELTVELERARAGDARGFDALFRALGAPVAGFLRGRNVSDPDGLANDVFLRAFRNIHTFRGDGDRFRSWLFTIAYNVAVDDARRRRRRVEATTLERTPEQAGGNVEDEVLVQLANERVATLLSGLSPDRARRAVAPDCLRSHGRGDRGGAREGV